MTAAVYYEPTRPKTKDWMQVLAAGCRGKIVANGRPDWTATDHVLIGNWPVASALIPQFKEAGADFWYCDSAYIQRPGVKSLRIERNRFWPAPSRVTHTLDRALAWGVEIQPWRRSGDYVLICLHAEKFGRPWGIDIVQWNAEIEARVREWTDRPIVVRRKPVNEAAKLAAPPLDEQIAGAWCVVTHSSTVAVHAVLAGTPVFCEPTCAAAPVACTDLSRIETPVRPARAEWVAALAWRQWRMDEIRSGEAWHYLKRASAHGY